VRREEEGGRNRSIQPEQKRQNTDKTVKYSIIPFSDFANFPLLNRFFCSVLAKRAGFFAVFHTAKEWQVAEMRIH